MNVFDSNWNRTRVSVSGRGDCFILVIVGSLGRVVGPLYCRGCL